VAAVIGAAVIAAIAAVVGSRIVFIFSAPAPVPRSSCSRLSDSRKLPRFVCPRQPRASFWRIYTERKNANPAKLDTPHRLGL
jgi:hypothetical protein